MDARRPRQARLPLALKGLLWRRNLSAAILITAIITTTAAALGPLYARAAAESTLRDELTQAQTIESGLNFQASNGYNLQEVTIGEYADDLKIAPKAGAVNGYPTRIQSLYWASSASVPKSLPLKAGVAWLSGQCAHMTLVQGRCPTTSHEVMVSARTVDFRQYGWKLGKTLTLGDGTSLTIVGVYTPKNIADGFWFGLNYFDAAPGQQNNPDTADSVFVSRSLFDRVSHDTQLRGAIDYPLDPNQIRLADVPQLQSDVAKLETKYNAKSALWMTTGIHDVLKAAKHQQDLVNTGTLLVTLQFTLLGWLVFFQVAADAIESRGAEIALAKLRGLRARETIRFGLGETLALLVIAIPIGLGLAVLAADGFAHTVLVPGTPVIFTWGALAAALAAFAGGLVAAIIAARRVLARPVLEQWRRTQSAPVHPRAGLILDVVVAAIAVAGLIVLRVESIAGDVGGTIALLAPGLLVAAIALLGTRLMPIAVRLTLPVTRASRRVAMFLAGRQVVRRPAALRLAALLAVAVGLATFGVGAEAVAIGNRSARAEGEIGASQSVAIQYVTGVDPVSAVHKADPGGTWAMATAEWLPDGGNSVDGTVLAVESSRLAKVGFPARGGADLPTIASAIGAATVPAVVLRASRIEATISARGLKSGAQPQVQFNLVNDLGQLVNAESTLMKNGRHNYSAPIACTHGCTFTGITWDRPFATDPPITGTAVIGAIRAGSASKLTAVNMRLSKKGAWRANQPQGAATDHVTATSAGASDTFESHDGGYGGIEYTYVPSPIPSVATHKAVLSGKQSGGTRSLTDGFGITTPFSVARWEPVLPSVLDDGVMMNITYLQSQLPDFNNEAVWHVWLSDAAPADAIAKLRASGLTIESVSTEANRYAELARQGPALSLLLLLASALAGAILAMGGTAISIGASARRRSYEAAALNVVGVTKRQLYRAALYEQLLILGTAVVLGLPGGIVAAVLTLPVIPEFATGTPIQLIFAPPAGPLIVFAVAFAVLVFVAAAITAAGVLRAARPGRLREAEE
jgi:hypothetical protein